MAAPALIAALLVGACAEPADPLAPLPRDAALALASCDAQPFPELAVTCRVEAASRAVAQGRPELADRACAAIGDPRWAEECHFRVGEEHGRRGALGPALDHCARAGRYARFCLTHTAWHAPPPPPGVGEAEWLAGAEDAMARAPADLAAAARDELRARYWFNLYLGAGSADPAAARAASHAAARQGFATEAVRLLVPRGAEPPADLVERVAAIWAGAEPPPRGEPLPPEARHGRYHPPLPTEPERDLARLPTYGGGSRLVSADPACDLAVATLEALYFLPETRAEAFAPHVGAPCRELSWTAARLVRVTPSDTLDHQAVLAGLAASPDPGLAAQGREGLARREWTIFTGGPRPR